MRLIPFKICAVSPAEPDLFPSPLPTSRLPLNTVRMEVSLLSACFLCHNVSILLRSTKASCRCVQMHNVLCCFCKTREKKPNSIYATQEPKFHLQDGLLLNLQWHVNACTMRVISQLSSKPQKIINM